MAEDEESAILVETEGREADVYCPEGGQTSSLAPISMVMGSSQQMKSPPVPRCVMVNKVFLDLKVNPDRWGKRIQWQLKSRQSNAFHRNSLPVRRNSNPIRNRQRSQPIPRRGRSANNGPHLRWATRRRGPEGQQGTDGAQGYSALIEQHQAPTSICPQGIVMHFGVDDGTDIATANAGILQQAEIRESLHICSEQLYEGLTGDIFTNSGDAMSSLCDKSEWSETSSVFIFSASDGTNGCELWLLDQENTPMMLMDIHASGDSIPGRELGIHVVETDRGHRFFFDADDGIHGRELWVSDGTSIGTTMLGDMESGDAINWNSEITTWMNGVVFTTNGNKGQNVVEQWKCDHVHLASTLVFCFCIVGFDQSISCNNVDWSRSLHGDASGLWFAAKETQLDSK